MYIYVYWLTELNFRAYVTCILMYKPFRTCEEIEYCNINEVKESSFWFVENGFVESFAEALVFLPLCAFVDVKRASPGIHVSLQFMFLREKRETMLEVCRLEFWKMWEMRITFWLSWATAAPNIVKGSRYESAHGMWRLSQNKQSSSRRMHQFPPARIS